MLLSDKIVQSYVEGFSGINVYCKEYCTEKIKEDFDEMFDKAWEKAMDNMELEYGDCSEREEGIENPAITYSDIDTVFIKLDPLYLSSCDGEVCDNNFGTKALEDTLISLKEKYPEISYEGLIAYEWSDTRCGEVVNYELASDDLDNNESVVYDFVGDILIEAVQDDLFWDKLSECLVDSEKKDFIKVLKDMLTYCMPDDAIEELLDIADNVDESIRPELEKMIEALG